MFRRTNFKKCKSQARPRRVSFAFHFRIKNFSEGRCHMARRGCILYAFNSFSSFSHTTHAHAHMQPRGRTHARTRAHTQRHTWHTTMVITNDQRVWPFQNASKCYKQSRDKVERRDDDGYEPLANVPTRFPRGAKLWLRARALSGDVNFRVASRPTTTCLDWST